ncbi:hypothetical protein HK100_012097 [Physocladia obscura]|uniref:polynucleotide adenylyltransferase n=1 Tax=Physocladia obscura TaxID=109957 RepID=A0AAD5XKK8_9FUNG|nr:hypothetical protein HK100_012097 [Physocladia obscura]
MHSGPQLTGSIAFVILPHDQQQPQAFAAVQNIRVAHDKAAQKWPPHLTLVGAAQTFQRVKIDIPYLEAKLQPISLCYAPFELTFDRISVLSHTHGCSIVLEPSQELFLGLTSLQKDVTTLLNLKEGKFPFRPHVTVASIESAAEDDTTKETIKLITEYLDNLNAVPFKCYVNCVAIMFRPNNTDEYSCVSSVQLAGARSVISSRELITQNIQVAFKAINSPFSFNRGSNEWERLASFEKISAWPSKQFTIVSYNVLNDPNDSTNFDEVSRFPRLCRTLEETDAEFIVLQEVNHRFLNLLCSLPWVKEQYYLSIANVKNDSEIPTGLVALSKFSFQSKVVRLSAGKQSLILSLSVTPKNSESHSIVNIAVVHLTSDYKADKSALRISQWKALLENLNSSSFVVGDFNSHEDEKLEYQFAVAGFTDAWTVMHLDSNGATFDPIENSIATQTSKRKRISRFDRVLSNTQNFQPYAFEILGKDIEDGKDNSDHYGILCTFVPTEIDFLDSFFLKDYNSANSVPFYQTFKNIQADFDVDTEFSTFLQIKNACPTFDSFSIRLEALETLQVLLKACFSMSPFQMTPVGSFALGTDGPSSDIDVLCIGMISLSEFFVNLRAAAPTIKNCTAQRIIEDAKVPIVELKICGVQVDLQYGCFHLPLGVNSVNIFDDIAAKPMGSSARLLMAGYIDYRMITKQCLACAPHFRLAVRFLKFWAKARGISGSKFGFPPFHALTVLLAKLCPPESENPLDWNGKKLVEKFFEVYSQHNWKGAVNGVIHWKNDSENIVNAQIDLRNPMVVFAPSSSSVNICRNVVASSREVWIQELKRAHELSGDLNTICQVTEILKNHLSFIHIEVSGMTSMQLIKLKNQVELRIVSLIVAVQRRCPSIKMRPWSVWMVKSDNDTETSANLLIGLDKQSDVTLEVSEKKQSYKKKALATLENALIQFEAEFSRWDGYESGMWVGVSHVSKNTIADLIIAPYLEFEEFEIPTNLGNSQTHDSATREIRFPDSENRTVETKKGKLRSSEDVFNRILWDSSFEREFFVIGYMDRFTGMQEISFNEFAIKREDQQGEEWIPFHRVWYFKELKKGREVLVWDRKSKLDLILHHITEFTDADQILALSCVMRYFNQKYGRVLTASVHASTALNFPISKVWPVFEKNITPVTSIPLALEAQERNSVFARVSCLNKYSEMMKTPIQSIMTIRYLVNRNHLARLNVLIWI